MPFTCTKSRKVQPRTGNSSAGSYLCSSTVDITTTVLPAVRAGNAATTPDNTRPRSLLKALRLGAAAAGAVEHGLGCFLQGQRPREGLGVAVQRVPGKGRNTT